MICFSSLLHLQDERSRQALRLALLIHQQRWCDQDIPRRRMLNWGYCLWSVVVQYWRSSWNECWTLSSRRCPRQLGLLQAMSDRTERAFGLLHSGHWRISLCLAFQLHQSAWPNQDLRLWRMFSWWQFASTWALVRSQDSAWICWTLHWVQYTNQLGILQRVSSQ